uniref:RRM domain-containing protein n=1 Tax=Rhabditophanes sp. KR3021 TaxID=114890 RepID=A0AC35TPR2_9BILA
MAQIQKFVKVGGYDSKRQIYVPKKMILESNGHSKKMEETKIFVGGIPYNVSEQELHTFFESRYGKVERVTIKVDRLTKRSRGFAFVEFESVQSCNNALNENLIYFQQKQIDIKPARFRENKKVFVGGLPYDFPEQMLKDHFEQFGPVESIEWPKDDMTGNRKTFLFINFVNECDADNAVSEQKQIFGNRECDVKKAFGEKRTYLNQIMQISNGPRDFYRHPHQQQFQTNVGYRQPHNNISMTRVFPGPYLTMSSNQPMQMSPRGNHQQIWKQDENNYRPQMEPFLQPNQTTHFPPQRNGAIPNGYRGRGGFQKRAF